MLTCQKAAFRLRADAPYLNCAYMSPLSKRVTEAGVAGIARKLHPADIVPADFFEGPARVRDRFARLIGLGEPRRVAIVPSVSYAMAVVARNTPVRSGQQIVTVEDQFPSNVYPWRRVCAETGACLRVVRPPSTGRARGESWNAALTEAIDETTAVVAVPPVHWTDGSRFDLVGLGARAREVGAVFVVDGTQAVGGMPFDVSEVEPDALACAGYKWLMGPYSIGVAYFGPRFDDGIPLEETWIARERSEDFSRLVDYQDRYREGATRFDVGEPSNFILTPMLVAALDQLLDWRVDRIEQYCRNLTHPLIEELNDRGFVATDDRWRGGHLFGVRLPDDYDREALQRRLTDRRISVSVRGSAVRVSPHVYNDEADIAALRGAFFDG